jgi:hypothetical protein
MLRDAAKVAADVDPHDEHVLRLEALSNGTLAIHRLGGHIRIVREYDE